MLELRLSGAIPGAIASLEMLGICEMGYNSLTSTIPNAMAFCTALEFLRLDGNQLSGSIHAAVVRHARRGTSKTPSVVSFLGNDPATNDDLPVNFWGFRIVNYLTFTFFLLMELEFQLPLPVVCDYLFKSLGRRIANCITFAFACLIPPKLKW